MKIENWKRTLRDDLNNSKEILINDIAQTLIFQFSEHIGFQSLEMSPKKPNPPNSLRVLRPLESGRKRSIDFFIEKH